MIIGCHYLGKTDIIEDELISANTFYILISGCVIKTIAKNLRMNIIKYEKALTSLLFKLTKPL